MSQTTLADPPVMTVPLVADFALTGDVANGPWPGLPWHEMARVARGQLPYRTRCKVAWSATGLYFLVECTDRHLTCSLAADYANLFTEDVVELFVQPDPAVGLYVEYEISPLGYELAILVPNHRGRFHGWQPWNQRAEQRTRKATAIHGGPRAGGAEVTGWSVEVFLPFALFTGFAHCPPTPGTRWRANLYRIDYDGGEVTHWAWCARTANRFHDYWDFGSLHFAGPAATP
jgi:hypothetical protein